MIDGVAKGLYYLLYVSVFMWFNLSFEFILCVGFPNFASYGLENIE